MGPSKLERLGWDPSLAEPPLLPARVLEVQRTGLFVATEAGELFAEISGSLQKELGESSICVGDWLLGSLSGKLFWVQKLLPRKNYLERAAAGDTGKSQGMVANIDELWIVVCADEHMSEELIERYITLASEAKVRPVLIFTKADIHPVEPKKLKKRFGEITILSVSVVDGTGLEGLRARMHKGSTIALMGSSGVGKSTLVNTLLSSTTQSTGSTRAYDGKGKHTTTYRKLLLSESGASLIDTPGMRALASAKPDDLDSFPDIDALSLQCRFRNCTHVTEPKCAVLQAVKDGKLVDARLKNFIKLQKEQSALPKSYGKKRK